MSVDDDDNIDDEDDDSGGCGGVSDDADGRNNDDDDTHYDGDGNDDNMFIISSHFISSEFRFTILISHCPQIARASLRELCLERAKYAFQMVSNRQVNKKLFI